MYALICLALKLVAVAAVFPASTRVFLQDLTACPAPAQSAISCLNNVSPGLEAVKTFINDVHDIKTKLDSLQSSISAAKAVLPSVEIVPMMSQAAKMFEHVLQDKIDNATRITTALDDVVYRFKQPIDKLATDIDRALKALTAVKIGCYNGSNFLQTVAQCVSALKNGTAKTSLGAALEQFSTLFKPPTSSVNQAMTTLGVTCSNIARFISAHSPPNLTFISEGLDTFRNGLSPMSQSLQSVLSTLNQQLCLDVPNPLEVIENGAAEVDLTMEVVMDIFQNKRKRGMISSDQAGINQPREEHRRINKRSWCVSVRDALNTSNTALSAFHSLANSTLDAVLASNSEITLPILPNFTDLAGFNVNFAIPKSLSLGLNFTLLETLGKTSPACVMNVMTACAGGIALPSDQAATCAFSHFSG